jgi:hypothetical protein
VRGRLGKGGASMLGIAGIKAAIEKLPEKDFFELRKWFWEKEWQKWDQQIMMDSESQKLDFLFKEALDEKNKGQLEEL